MPLGHKPMAVDCDTKRRGIAEWAWLGVTCWGKLSYTKGKAVAEWIALMCGALSIFVGVPREVTQLLMLNAIKQTLLLSQTEAVSQQLTC